jgi:hypothetical protein
MRSLSEIHSEKDWVTANLKKAGLWCGGGLAITILSLLVASHVGFSIITLSAIGWGGWNVFKFLKRLDELKEEEKKVKDYEHPSESHVSVSSPFSKTLSSSSSTHLSTKLRSKTWK